MLLKLPWRILNNCCLCVTHKCNCFLRVQRYENILKLIAFCKEIYVNYCVNTSIKKCFCFQGETLKLLFHQHHPLGYAAFIKQYDWKNLFLTTFLLSCVPTVASGKAERSSVEKEAKTSTFFLLQERLSYFFGAKKKGKKHPPSLGHRPEQYVLSFGANERTKENIHPIQGLPLYGKDAIDFRWEPPCIKILVWLAKPVPYGRAMSVWRLAHWENDREYLYNLYHRLNTEGCGGRATMITRYFIFWAWQASTMVIVSPSIV